MTLRGPLHTSILQATLIGLDFPVNSVGVLPTSYLDASDKMKTMSLAANAEQILAQFLVKEGWSFKRIYE